MSDLAEKILFLGVIIVRVIYNSSSVYSIAVKQRVEMHI